MHKSRQAFLLLTHFISRPILREMRKISIASHGLGDPWLLIQRESLPEIVQKKRIPAHLVTGEDLHSLGYGYKEIKIIPGKAHFPLLHFSRHYPNYDYYWIIEYDVRFTGNWHHLFSTSNNSEGDLITSHIRNYKDEPDWPHWDLSHPTEVVPLDARTSTFNPIYRISNEALAIIDDKHHDGWQGHNEVLIPTLLQTNDKSVTDFNELKKASKPGRYWKFYIKNDPGQTDKSDSGSLRYRPVHKRSPYLPCKLYHPIKRRESRPWNRDPSGTVHQLKVHLSYLAMALRQSVN